MIRPDWFPDWRGQPCAVVASGPSALATEIHKLRGRCRVIAVNTSYRLAPWADALYAGDARWWDWHRGAPDFTGIKITQSEDAARKYGLHLVHLLDPGHPLAHSIIMDRPGLIGRGDNGGFQALNLAAQFGGSPILLVGIDCAGARWHGKHPGGNVSQKPSTLAHWARLFDSQAPTFDALGISVLNCSPLSALQEYPKVSIDDAIDRELSSSRR